MCILIILQILFTDAVDPVNHKNYNYYILVFVQKDHF